MSVVPISIDIKYLLSDVIRFDNSYSIVRSKKLSYFVELISSEQTESPHKASALTPTRQEHEEITDDAVHDVALD